jgi:uncharacterized protein YecE (DUF72 family)
VRTIGTAGWSLPSALRSDFPDDGTHLSRYAQRLSGVEINSTFYRRHRRSTFTSWATQVPDGFRFAVKMPRLITHELALRSAAGPLDDFVSDIEGLGQRLGPVLIQLPPGLDYDGALVRRFLQMLRDRFAGAVVCEPRHPSWHSPAATAALTEWRIGRVAAHPPRLAPVEEPGAWLGPSGDGAAATIYYRLHGHPRIYWSNYDDAALAEWARRTAQWPAGADVWCIFDNTAAGAATANALALQRLVPRT